jgi:hypothetical protein
MKWEMRREISPGASLRLKRSLDRRVRLCDRTMEADRLICLESSPNGTLEKEKSLRQLLCRGAKVQGRKKKF